MARRVSVEGDCQWRCEVPPRSVLRSPSPNGPTLDPSLSSLLLLFYLLHALHNTPP